jgi:hypothetical protein
VNDKTRRGDELAPSEERLGRLLEPLRADAPRGGATLPRDVARTASWQLFVKRVAVATADVLVAAGETLATLVGLGRRK